MNTRLISRCFLPVFLLWCVTIPRTAYAFVPAAVGGYGLPTVQSVATASGGSTAAASVGAVDLFAAGALIAVGAAISYFAIDYLVGGQNNTVRIPLTSDPAKAVPAPSAPATTATQTTTTYTSQTTPYCSQTFSGADGLTVCNQMAACDASGRSALNISWSWVISSFDSATNNCMGKATNDPGSMNPYLISHITGTTSSGCPAGYSLSGNSCVLSNARAATPDKACDLQRSGSALAMISDPDCTASGSAIPTICAADGTSCVGYGTSANGQPRSYVIVPQPGGGSVISTFQQGTISGQTVVTSNVVSFNPDGTVGSVSSSTAVGSIPNPATSGSVGTGTSAVPNVQPTTGAAVTPSTNNNTTTFPTDYARQGEAATAAATLAPKLDTLHNDLTTPATDTALATEQSTLTTAATNQKNLLDNLGNKGQGNEGGVLSMSLPQPVVQEGCTDPTVNVFGGIGNAKTIQFTGFCDKILMVRSLVEWVLYVFTMYSLFVIVTRRHGEE